MRAVKFSFLPLLLASLCLVSPAQDTRNSFAALDGIWQIAGSRTPIEFPAITLSIAVNGDTIYANGHLDVLCSNVEASSGIGFYVAGKIADDGTFILTNIESMSSPRFTHVEIRGTVPSAGSANWAGSFAVMNGTTPIDESTPTVCAFSSSQDFVATAFPSMSGIWSGNIHIPSLGTDLNVSAEIKQEEVAPDEPAHELSTSPAPNYYIPIRATITVSGYRTFTTSDDRGSAEREHMVSAHRVDADSFILTFPMDDGSTFMLSGNYTDLAGSDFNVSYSIWVNGQPTSEGGGGTLTRQ
jgi:hypothetical protein